MNWKVYSIKQHLVEMISPSYKDCTTLDLTDKNLSYRYFKPCDFDFSWQIGWNYQFLNDESEVISFSLNDGGGK